MTSNERRELKKRLILPDHCPNQWDWAKFHSEGEVIFFNAKGHHPDIISLGPCSAKISYTYENNFVSFDRKNHFAVIEQGLLIGYFSPTKRRAVFFAGPVEPRGLLMFFLWHALFGQYPSRLPDLFQLCFDKSTKAIGDLNLDFENFLEIRDLIGEKLCLYEIVAIANNMVDSVNEKIRTIQYSVGDQWDSWLAMECDGKTKKQFIDNQLRLIADARLTVGSSDSVSECLRHLLNLYRVVNFTLKHLH